MNGRRRWPAWIVAALTLPAILAPLLLVVPDEGVSLGLLVGWCLVTAIFVLALWLTLRVPANAVTWTLLLTVAGAITYQSAYDYVDKAADLGLPAVRLIFGLGSSVFWMQIVLGLVVFPLVFPTGQPPSARWGWVVWVAVAGLVPQIARALYLAATLPDDRLADGPTGVGVVDVLVTIGQGAIAVAAVAAVVSLGVRFRRSTGTERQQVKALLVPLTFLVFFWVAETIQQESPVSLALLLVGGVTLPVALVVAIMRYRLYDIDRIVSRTVTYTLVIGLLAAVYAGATVFLTRVLPVDSTLAVAASTLAVAALFTPLRRRIQRIVDRRFNRTRYRAEKEVEAFTTRLRDTTDVDAVQADLIDVISRTLQPSAVGVWIRGHAGTPRTSGHEPWAEGGV